MSKTRRIAMISEHASPLATLGGEDAGGQNVYVAELSRHLVPLGYQVDVFTRRDSPDLPEVVPFAEGVRVVNVTAGPAEPIKKDLLLPYMLPMAQGVAWFTQQQGLRYDLVHANFWMSGLVALESRHVLRAPIVQTFHALGATKRLHQGTADSSPPQRHSIETRIVREVDCIVATCPAEVEELRRYYRANTRKVRVVPSGVDPKLFSPVPKPEARRRLGLDESEMVLLCVSRMVPRKGIDNAIRALAVLYRQTSWPLRLLVVGGDPEDQRPFDNLEVRRLARVAQDEGVAHMVTFAGRKHHRELKLYYSAADVFVSTPWYEPFGLTPIEAMACGTPVVASAVGGHTFTIVDGVTGLLVPPQDPEYLASALRLLLNDHGLRDRMAEAARRRAEGLFAWERVAAQVDAVYQEVIAGASLPPAGTPVANTRAATRPGGHGKR